MIKDYYKVMGLTREATGEELKKTYRELAMKFHPDRNQDKPECEDRLKEINEAYRVLGNEENRFRYDLSCQRASESYSFDAYGPYKEDDLSTILRAFSQSGMGSGTIWGCRRGFKGGRCGAWKRRG